MSRLEIFQGLEEASSRHEKEIVVEFSVDRFLHFLGVYLVVILAIVAKVDELTGPKASCYAATGHRDYDRRFIEYANVYCWESHAIDSTSNHTACQKHKDEGYFNSTMFVHDAVYIKGFMQWIPYGMLVQALLLSLPSAWWHFRVGGRLMGHLKFLRLLINDIQANVKDLPAGFYARVEQNFQTECDKNGDWSPWRALRCASKLEISAAEEGRSTDLTRGSQAKQDRDIFSLLCYENFSSFTHMPYITSILRLTARNQNQAQNTEALPLMRAVLLQFSHQENFSKDVLVRCYMTKYRIGIAASLISSIALVIVTVFLWKNEWTTATFLCDIIYHNNACLYCTLPTVTVTVGFHFVNLAITLAYLIVAIWRLATFICKDEKRKTFLNSIDIERSLAFIAAHNKKKHEEESG